MAQAGKIYYGAQQNPCVITNLSNSNQHKSYFSVSLKTLQQCGACLISLWGLKKSNSYTISPVRVTASISTLEKALEIVLQPIREISGLIKLPGSKPLSNQILTLAALSKGTIVVENLLNSDDISNMLVALNKLGLNVERDSENKCSVIERCGVILPPSLDSNSNIKLYVANAGTAMRPLTAAVIAADGNTRDLVVGLKQFGADVESTHGTNCPFVRVNANSGLPGGKVKLYRSISSQNLTAQLMAASLAPGDFEIEIIDKLIYVPYCEHSDSWDRFFVKGGQKYKSPGNTYVGDDASSATYFFAGAAITGETVTNEDCETNH
ncbi:hypothetical protein N665_0658s0004 [Sinapis alba]|nr:hypothetical protein N665_0658s0004 [Sinapis alba]